MIPLTQIYWKGDRPEVLLYYRGMTFKGMSQLELTCVELRVKGLTNAQIGEQLGKSADGISGEISRVCRKARIKNDLATLRLWALQWGFDEPLPPETPGERARPGKPVPRYQRIRLGRIRRGGGVESESLDLS
jgi:DNA-binding CsgD family transcriptional regulator